MPRVSNYISHSTKEIKQKAISPYLFDIAFGGRIADCGSIIEYILYYFANKHNLNDGRL